MEIGLENVVLRHPEMKADLLRVGTRAIRPGSPVVLRGPSGCGKTTLLHALALLLPPAAGEIRVDGAPASSLGEAARARIRRHHFGIVFQRLNLLEHLTAEENVRLGRPGVSRRTARDALARMGLQELADRRGEVLSLGEQQRVAVARVLAARPSVILADEPTSALDDANAALVLDALAGEAARGAVLVVVTHDPRVDDSLGEVWSVADGALR